MRLLLNLCASIGLLFLSLLIFFVIAESTTRYLYPTESEHPFLVHQLFGEIRPPNTVFYNKSNHKLSFDEFGFRGNFLSNPKQPNTYRILFVGASVVEAPNQPIENSLPYIVSQQLQKRYETINIEVAGVGYPGNKSWHSLSQIIRRLPNLKPDLIIQLDSPDFFKWLYPQGYNPTYIDILHSYVRTKPTLLNWLILNSLLVKKLTRWSTFETIKESRRISPINDPPLDKINIGINDSKYNFKVASLVAKFQGAQYALMTHSFIYKNNLSPDEDSTIWLTNQFDGNYNLSMPVAVKMVEDYNNMIRRLANDDIWVIDAEKEMPKNLDYFVDDVHLTKKGYQLLANIVTREIIDSKNIERWAKK